ncbi:hypothetical protein [Aquisphaera insulae]|uniref:hypothetical protein n=1 Tax=Aquisphaera insulae TaxID=2712864 RepID=UPI0013EA2EC0|nr:hypothetical protein [Aquisphaera insulae]
MLIPGLFHVPLPEADFHNVRHHDAAGENCPNHEHLLRWHPSAGRAADVSILHWHWFVPSGRGSEPPQTDGLTNDLGHRGFPAGPALHAYLPIDASAPDWGRSLAFTEAPRRLFQGLATGPDGRLRPILCTIEVPPIPPDPGRLDATGDRARPAAESTSVRGERRNC